MGETVCGSFVLSTNYTTFSRRRALKIRPSQHFPAVDPVGRGNLGDSTPTSPVHHSLFCRSLRKRWLYFTFISAIHQTSDIMVFPTPLSSLTVLPGPHGGLAAHNGRRRRRRRSGAERWGAPERPERRPFQRRLRCAQSHRRRRAFRRHIRHAGSPVSVEMRHQRPFGDTHWKTRGAGIDFNEYFLSF